MKRSLLILSSALLFAVAASVPPKLSYSFTGFDRMDGPLDIPPVRAPAGGVTEAQVYPACRPGRGDDRCIQLYERRVRQALAPQRRTRTQKASVPAFRRTVAAARPAQGQGGPCMLTLTDDCIDRFDREREARASTPARPRETPSTPGI